MHLHGIGFFAAASGLLCCVSAVRADDLTLRNQQQEVIVHASDGSYELFDQALRHSVIHARVGAQLDHHWTTCTDYPDHQPESSSFSDALGAGHQIVVRCTGLPAKPDLTYTIRLYDNIPAGTVTTEVHNTTASELTVQSIRPVEGIDASRPVYTGPSESADRVLDDSFSEDWPPLQIYDYNRAPEGTFRAVGSQLIYNRASRTSLFFGALASDRFLTVIHWHVKPAAGSLAYTIDSTGTTEIQATDPESGLKDGPRKNLIELSLPLAPGATMHSEPLMFATSQDYYATLDHYGEAIRTLHKSRTSGPMLGWWSWTAFYSDITQGNTSTNAQWLAQHLERLGYDYFHLDLGYAYARGEYATPNAAQFPEGLLPLSHEVCHLGLRLGFWTAPFEVSDRSSVYEHHKDWLVHNAQGEPIQIGEGDEAGREILFVLDATNPAAQQYLRDTYRTLTQDWGGEYIKLDFMDNTAIEGDYYRPHTTALEAQRIGLEVIRQALGDRVLLDKDGSPMLNPVGLVDEGRLSQDTGHSFQRSKEAAPGIAARYYMNHNFFLSDPDAFTVSRQLIEERKIQAPLTLAEAQVSIALAAVSGGMFEIGDDLPTLGKDADRLALVENPELIRMAELGRAARPLDLLTYRAEEQQPSVFLLHEDRRQSMLAVFNWTDQPRSHAFSLADFSLPAKGRYRISDVFDPRKQLSMADGQLSIGSQRPHTVRLLKIVDDSVPPHAPAVAASIPPQAKIGEIMRLSAHADDGSVPALTYTWDFGDGVTATGTNPVHAWTHGGKFTVGLTVQGVDDIPYRTSSTVNVTGTVKMPSPERYTPKP